MINLLFFSAKRTKKCIYEIFVWYPSDRKIKFEKGEGAEVETIFLRNRLWNT
ncbi:hypothetical protein C815_00757 [Firmicutes bacterium M10-2]|nr:hypothetical protein C815_00757 [Firmicutes bacterium M10-2]